MKHFNDKKMRDEHIIAIHEGKKPHKCSLCDSSFGVKAHLRVHIERVHEGKKSYKCLLCTLSVQNEK